MTLKRIFSEMIFGKSWKEKIKSQTVKTEDIIIGPDGLFFLILSMTFLSIFFLLMIFDEPAELSDRFRNWQWLIYSALLFVTPLNKAGVYKQSKNPNTAYWIGVMVYLMAFMAGVLIGAFLMFRMG